ncbi:MAG: bifunctional phosphopantothenoylcysteine decarboxylase/phosphopantothenate--cysteine ligase CoaBC [Thermovirgaceae bacterium]
MAKTDWKRHRKLLLCITGGIAAYKIPELVRAFSRREWDVEIILTEAAERFVSAFTLSVLSRHKVWYEADFLSNERGFEIPHVRLAQSCDVLAVAPCTATTLANLAAADASSLIPAAALAARAPVLLFPSMNTDMWQHKGVQQNCRKCREYGYIIVDPDQGQLACREEGKGRLPEIEIIEEEILKAACPGKKELDGLRVLVTAGPTHEYLDPVRYISNPSSGKMGFSLAKTAWYRGAEVTAVAGPVMIKPPHGVRIVPVVEADQMLDAVLRESEGADIIIKAAAVGDYKAASPSAQKIKRNHGPMTIELFPNPDILAELGKKRRKGQILVGFAAETQDFVENASSKLSSKGIDLIAVNDVHAPGKGFAGDRNEVTVLDSSGIVSCLAGTKDDVAEGLWDVISDRWQKQT